MGILSQQLINTFYSRFSLTVVQNHVNIHRPTSSEHPVFLCTLAILKCVILFLYCRINKSLHSHVISTCHIRNEVSDIFLSYLPHLLHYGPSKEKSTQKSKKSTSYIDFKLSSNLCTKILFLESPAPRATRTRKFQEAPPAGM